jgi:hypothetical protein
MLTKRVALRAVPALMLTLFVACCSRAPEEPAQSSRDTEVVVVIAAEPPAPEQQPESSVAFPEEPVLGFGGGYGGRRSDEFTEDPSDSPNHDLAANPNEYDGYESPHPNRNSTSAAVGLGGGTRGGGGRGGKAGFAYRRARGGGG